MYVYIYIIQRNTHLSMCKGLSSPTPNLYPYSKCKWKSQNERKSFPPLWPVSGKVYPIWILGQKKYPFSLPPPRKLFFENRTKHAKISL